MPTIQQNQKGGKIIFDSNDWLAGLNPQYSASASARQKMGNGLAAARSFDPYRDFGYASPGYNPTDLTNVSVIDAVQVNCVVNGAYGYSVGGTKVHQIDLTNEALNATPHAIASSVMQDCIVYKIGATPYLFYSWYDGTDGDVGRYDFGTWTTAGSWDDDYMSAVPTGKQVFANTSKPMPMIIGSDDVLYIGVKNVVYAFDGATTTLSPNVLTLPAEYNITGFARYGTHLAVFASTDSTSFALAKATVFFWNYLDLDPSKVIDLNDNYVSAPFEYNGTVGCFTQGRVSDKTQNTKSCKLKIFDGLTFKTFATSIGNAPAIGGVDISGDMIQWNSGGKIYSFGSPFLGIDAKLNQIMEGLGTSSGFLKTLTTATVLQIASTGTTTSGGMQNLKTNYYEQSLVATALAKPNWPVGKKGRITTIITKYAKTSSAGLLLTGQLLNRLGTILSEFVTDVSAITADTYISKNEDVNAVFDDMKLVLSWSGGTAVTDAPIIDSVEVEFEYVNL